MAKTSESYPQRGITGNRVLRYAKFADKMIFYNLVTPKERKEFFKAVKVLRDLSDQYCNITGLPLEEDDVKPEELSK